MFKKNQDNKRYWFRWKYEIKIEKRSPTGGYDAYFDHKIAVNPSCKYSYSSEWTEQEIREDLVYKLLSWSGLKIKTVLDYWEPVSDFG